MTKKYTLLLFFSLLACTMLPAQKAGYMGRRFMVKANLLNGLRPQYFGGEVEYAVARRITIGAGGGYQIGRYKQLYYTQYYDTQYSQSPLYYKKHMSDGKNAKIKAFSLYGQIKFFPFNRLKAAPDGFYLGIKAGGGYADVTSKPGYPITQNIYPTVTKVPQSFSIKGVPFAFYEFGPGIQKVLGGRFVIDANAYLNVTTFNGTGSKESRTYTATLARQFGPNTAWLGGTLTDQTAPNGYVAPKNVTPRDFTTNFGVSLYLKIGILIF